LAFHSNQTIENHPLSVKFQAVVLSEESLSDIPCLICTEGALKEQRFEVPDDGLNIGRSDENHIVIIDDDVSRFHARIIYDNGALWLQDSGSRNGVFVNDARVTGHKALKVGHQIKIADHIFEVMWQADLTEVKKPSEESKDKSNNKPWFWPFS
jgi:pSer/pThr/pTyr-binding forkhead associated (FHA) protein